MARLSIVCALAQGRVIGREGRLPWHIPADWANFKRLTWGKVVVMGRKTWDSLGRPLPQRTNVVLSREPHFQAPGATVFPSLMEAIEAYREEEEIFLIGGAQLISQALPLVQRQYLSLIQHPFAGDTFYPLFPPLDWVPRAHRHYPRGEGSPYEWDFLLLERLEKGGDPLYK